MMSQPNRRRGFRQVVSRSRHSYSIRPTHTLRVAQEGWPPSATPTSCHLCTAKYPPTTDKSAPPYWCKRPCHFGCISLSKANDSTPQLGAEAVAILAGDDERLDHLGVFEVAVELIQLA